MFVYSSMPRIPHARLTSKCYQAEFYAPMCKRKEDRILKQFKRNILFL